VVRRAALAAAALALAACDTNFEPQWRVRDLRILAARAEVVGEEPVADGDAGLTLRLAALVANPARLADVTIRWKACLPQAGAVVSPCLDPAVLRDPARLDGAPGVVDLGEGESVTVTVPSQLSVLLDALRERAVAEPGLACTLYLELPVVIVARGGGVQRLAVKTVRLTQARPGAAPPLDRYVRNRNPGLGAVRSGPTEALACGPTGAPVARACTSDADCDGVACRRDAPPLPGARAFTCDDPLPRLAQALCADPLGRPEQPYLECRGDGSSTLNQETLSFQWYATGGTLERSGDTPPVDTGNVTGGDVRFTPPPGAVTLWVIVRDGRGGEGWLRRDFP
jgi:hypothetical protein